MKLETYLKYLKNEERPKFIEKYLQVASLLRLKRIGYFCGMDYASKDIYDFSEYVSRYQHSLNTALITYNLTEDKIMTIASLFHDIATPCTAHVIDYMNKDYLNQESTEEYTGNILRKDKYLKECLKEDQINIEDIINFKQFSIVDNTRPKLCADRLDGIILPGLFWTKNLTLEEVLMILKNLRVYTNEDNEAEIGFASERIASKVLEINKSIDIYCHSNYDNYMMDLLSKIIKRAIDLGLVTYEDLYVLDEERLFCLLNSSKDLELQTNLYKFYHIKKEDIPSISLPPTKKRVLCPLVDGKRIK